MRLTINTFTAALLLACSTTEVLAHPQPVDIQLLTREQSERLDARHIEIFGDAHELWKRKGGGGGGGKGGSSSSGKSGSSGSSRYVISLIYVEFTSGEGVVGV
jgi:hypothetical protein